LIYKLSLDFRSVTYRLAEGAEFDPNTLVGTIGLGNAASLVDLLNGEIVKRMGPRSFNCLRGDRKPGRLPNDV
jgi:hypothetical protein